MLSIILASEYASRARRNAFATSLVRNWESLFNWAMASANALGFRGGTITPLDPFSISSPIEPTGVLITGTPQACACMIACGTPSLA